MLKDKSFFWGGVAVLYAGTSVLFFFKPDALFYILNFFPKVFNVLEPLPDPIEALTVVLSGGFFATLSCVSFMMFLHPKRKTFPVIHFVAAASVCGGFSQLYLQGHRYFGYAFVFVVEALLGLGLLWNLLKRPFHRKKTIPQA